MNAKKEKNAKRYYWLKLNKDYFGRIIQKKMRKQPDGAIMQIIYLKMMLKSIDNNGRICYLNYYDTLEEELAEEFDESVDTVKRTLEFLRNNELMEVEENDKFFIPEVLDCTGSESSSTERVRRHREKKKEQDSTVGSSKNQFNDGIKSEYPADSELENSILSN